MSKIKPAFISRIVVSVSLLALLLWLARENFAKIWSLLSKVDLFVFSFSFLVFLISVLFLAWRLKVVLAAQKATLSIKESFGLTLIGYFFTNFMPTSVGGDLVKGYYISKKNENLKLLSLFFL